MEITRVLGDFTALAFLGVAFLMVIRALVIRMSIDIQNNTRALRALQATQLEVFRVLMLHDARLRGINPNPSPQDSDDYRMAAEQYRHMTEALNKLRSTLETVSKDGGHQVGGFI